MNRAHELPPPGYEAGDASPQRIVVALVLTGVFGAVGAIALALSGGQARPRALGPWLSVGAVASILLG